jgi:hypothetical protein
LTEEQRKDATQIRDFTTGGKPFGALDERGEGRGHSRVATAENATITLATARLALDNFGHGAGPRQPTENPRSPNFARSSDTACIQG